MSHTYKYNHSKVSPTPYNKLKNNMKQSPFLAHVSPPHSECGIQGLKTHTHPVVNYKALTIILHK
jgi:hypothetical protein